MKTVREIHEFLQTLAPESMQESWDHVGLLCGRANAPVTRILVALDPFRAACEEAKALGAQLLVTHHPAIWELSAVNDGTAQGRNLLFLIENGIAALNAHTNLDKAPGGVNDCLAAALGLADVQVVDPEGTDGQGRPYGLLRCGKVCAQSPAAFAQFVKAALSCPGLRYADGGREIRTVFVGGGACAGELARAAELGCDAFVTADVKYNAFADAVELGVTLIDAGHFETENPVCTYLAESLRTQFPEIEVFVSKTNTDPIKFV